jgi:mRNA interferase MazF
MANPSRFSFGDVVLVPFPFTDQSGTKKRPAGVVSSHSYNASRRDIVIMAITSQVRTPLGFGEAKHSMPWASKVSATLAAPRSPASSRS